MNTTDEYAEIFAEAIVESMKARKERLRKGLILKPADVKVIRDKKCLTQMDFAEKYGIPLLTLQNWEQNRRKPDVVANIYLHLVDSNSELIEKEIFKLFKSRKLSIEITD